MSVDAMLQPIVDALVPTTLGRPKTQTVISRYLQTFRELRRLGFTYQRIATRLNELGGRGRTGAEFTGQSLATCVRRAEGCSAVAARQGPPAGPACNETPVTRPNSPRNSPISIELEQFRRCISDAQEHTEMSNILFRRRKSG